MLCYSLFTLFGRVNNCTTSCHVKHGLSTLSCYKVPENNSEQKLHRQKNIRSERDYNDNLYTVPEIKQLLKEDFVLLNHFLVSFAW